MEESEYQLNQLRKQNEELQMQLQEARTTLDAICNGEVDALVVGGPDGEQIFSLKGADYSYRVLIEEMQEGAITLSEDGSILYANSFMEKILETSLAKIIGKSVEMFVYPPDLPDFKAVVKQSMHCHGSAEIRLVSSNGLPVPAYLSASRITMDSMIVFCLTLTDLTHQKRHERILAEERLSRSIVEQSADAIIVFDDRGIVIRGSQVAFDLIGSNCLNMHFDDAFRLYLKKSGTNQSISDPEFEPFTIDRVIAGEKIHSQEAFIKKESTPGNNLLLSATPMMDASGCVIGGIVNLADITEKAETERQLKENREWLDVILKSIADGIIATDEQGRVSFMNPIAEKFTGWNKAEALGRPVDEIFKIINEETREAVINPVSKVLDKGIIVELANHNILHTLLITKDGGEIPINDSAAPINISVDRCVGVVLLFKDDSERRSLADQLQQAQKMESVGRLAGGVAHDFNNMLMVILGNVELTLDILDTEEPVYDFLLEIQKAANSSSQLTRQLLAFARKQTINPEVLDFNETVERMLKMLRRLIGENIDLAWLPGNNLWSVNMDPSQIDQILANLCVNARDAIHTVGKVTIETKNSNLNHDYCSKHLGVVPGEYVQLAFTDTGHGMEKETLKNIFEPFFTTKELGKGTGLGLSTIYGIVKQNNGFIHVDSEVGKGTIFTIYLPRHIDSFEHNQNGDHPSILHGNETILLVEDQTAILKTAKFMLERIGYTVFTASTPGEAIRIARNYNGEVDLLITDVVMPEMNGLELSKHIVSIYPNITLLFMSGYTADIIAHNGVLDAGIHFIQKPFSLQELSAKIKDVMESQNSHA